MEHELIGLEIIVILVLILTVMMWDQLPILKHIPSSVAAMCLGMIVSVCWTDIDDAPFLFASELFLYILLPPILLNSAFKFNTSDLKQTWLSSLTFGLLGTALAVILIAWGIVVWTSIMGLTISWVDALMFASILAPTDTVATLSLSKSLDDTFISSVLENESIINDALSVVLVRLFATMSANHQALNRWVPVRAIGTSVLYMFVACLVGISFAFAVRTIKIKTVHVHFIIAMCTYAFCEYIGISGIVGLFSYGCMVNPPQKVMSSIEGVSVVVEAYVYLTLGFAVRAYEREMLFISCLILFSCIVSRVAIVFVLGFCLRLLGRKQWTVRSTLFVSMCGIRGAISFALCMGLRSNYSSMIVSSTLVTIVATTILMGSLQKCMQKVLL